MQINDDFTPSRETLSLLHSMARTLSFLNAKQRGQVITQLMVVSTTLGRLAQSLCNDLNVKVTYDAE